MHLGTLAHHYINTLCKLHQNLSLHRYLAQIYDYPSPTISWSLEQYHTGIGDTVKFDKDSEVWWQVRLRFILSFV